MIRYKMIHTADGYLNLYDDEENSYKKRIERDIDIMSALESDKNETFYLYYVTNNKVIFFRRENNYKTGYFDFEKEFIADNKYNEAYPTELLFNDRIFPLDNSNSVYSGEILRARYLEPAISRQYLDYVPYIADRLINSDDIISIKLKSVDDIKDLFSFISHMLPIKLAKRIGMAINLSYISGDKPLADGIRLYGYTADSFNPNGNTDIDLDLTKRLDRELELSSYGEDLSLYASDSSRMADEASSLLEVFDSNGNIDNDLLLRKIPERIFRKKRDLASAEALLNIIYENRDYRVSINVVNMLLEVIRGVDAYSGELKAKLDRVIAMRPELKQIGDELRLEYFDGLLAKLSRLDNKGLDELAAYYTDENTKTPQALIDALTINRSLQGLLLLIKLYTRGNPDSERMQFYLDYFNVDKTHNVSFQGRKFDDVIIETIFKLKHEDLVRLAGLFLYSAIIVDTVSRQFASNRLNSVLKKIKDMRDSNSKPISSYASLSIICDIYDELIRLLEFNLGEASRQYYNTELFDQERLKSLVSLEECSTPTAKRNRFFDLLRLVIDGKCNSYGSLRNMIRDTINSRDSKGEAYYKKYISQDNIELLDSFYNQLEEEKPKEMLQYIDSLLNESELSQGLSEYRIGFIYNTFLSCNNKTRRTILKQLGIVDNDSANKEILNRLRSESKELQDKTSTAIANQVLKEKDYIIQIGTPLVIKELIMAILIGVLLTVLALVLFNIPIIIKAIALNKDFMYLFLNETTTLMPLVIVISFGIYIFSYMVYIKRRRQNVWQAVWDSTRAVLIAAYWPILLYVLSMIIIYFV